MHKVITLFKKILNYNHNWKISEQFSHFNAIAKEKSFSMLRWAIIGAEVTATAGNFDFQCCCCCCFCHHNQNFICILSLYFQRRLLKSSSDFFHFDFLSQHLVSSSYLHVMLWHFLMIFKRALRVKKGESSIMMVYCNLLTHSVHKASWENALRRS